MVSCGSPSSSDDLLKPLVSVVTAINLALVRIDRACLVFDADFNYPVSSNMEAGYRCHPTSFSANVC